MKHPPLTPSYPDAPGGPLAAHGSIVILGVLGLCLGAAVYLFCRAPGSYLWGKLLSGGWGGVLGKGALNWDAQGGGLLAYPLTCWLPSFAHVLGWSLITAGILSLRSKPALAGVCLLWLMINGLLELGQKYALQAGNLLPEWPAAAPLTELMRNYWNRGTYDCGDLAAAAAGAATAYVILLMGRERTPSWSGDFSSSATPSCGERCSL